MKAIFVGAACLLAGGCAYQAEPVSTPAYNVVTSFSNKVPGKWLLFVDGNRLSEVVRPSDINCAAHTFPLSMASGFSGSVRSTLENVLASVEQVDSAPTIATARARGARGIVVVRGEEVRGQLRVAPGFWSANIVTEVRITASVAVDGASGRLFGQTVEGDGKGDTPAGPFCSGGADSLKKASEDALRNSVRKVAEAIGNADRLRR